MREKWKQYADRGIHVGPATDGEIEEYLGSLNSMGRQVYGITPPSFQQKLIARLLLHEDKEAL